MALQVNINSYVSVTQANTYFEDRINASQWDTATNQDEALVTATGILNELAWNGTANPSTSYPLAWPRSIEFSNPISGYNETLVDDRTTTSAGSVPQDIKDATCELAYHLLINTDLLDNTSTVQDLTVRGIRLIGSKKAILLSSTTSRLINKYLSDQGLGIRTVRVGG